MLFLDKDLGAGNKELTAPAGILHMAYLILAAYFHMGDKPVWTAYEYAGAYIQITHVQSPGSSFSSVLYRSFMSLEKMKAAATAQRR